MWIFYRETFGYNKIPNYIVKIYALIIINHVPQAPKSVIKLLELFIRVENIMKCLFTKKRDNLL